MTLKNKNSSNQDCIMRPMKGKKEKSLPENGLFLVNPGDAAYALNSCSNDGYGKQFLFNSNMMVSREKSFFVAGPSVGSPMAVMTLEKLIALGAKRIYLYGWCGAISSKLEAGDLVLPLSALSGEGTSQYYGNEGLSYPSARLVDNLRVVIEEQDLVLKEEGKIWTTDAPYREKRDLVDDLATRHNVIGVDMELSSLCSVASFRNIDFAALFLVSDMLWKPDWKPMYATKFFRSTNRKILDKLLKYLPDFKY